MKSNRKILLVVFCTIFACGVIGLIASRAGRLSIMFPVEHKAEFQNEITARFPIKLKVKGNQILDEDGKVIMIISSDEN